MILYNVTVSIDVKKADEWLHWMRTKHIPGVMATSCFIEDKNSKIFG
jgi:hypothetical protein